MNLGGHELPVRQEGASDVKLAIQVVVFFLSFLAVSWLIDGEASVLMALIGTAAVMGITRLLTGRWGLF